MSFTQDVKLEITHINPERKCCQLAELAGFIRFAGSVTISGGKLGLKVTTDSPAAARKFITLAKSYFGAKTALSMGEPVALGKGKSYVLNITPESHEEIGG